MLRSKYGIKELWQLEHYLFALIRLTETDKFKKLQDVKKQTSVYHEIFSIRQSLEALGGFLLDQHGEELHKKQYVAWQEPEKRDKFITVYTFSSKSVVTRALGMTSYAFINAHFHSNEKNRGPHERWWVMPLAEYTETMIPDEEDIFISGSLINHINIHKHGSSKIQRSS